MSSSVFAISSLQEKLYIIAKGYGFALLDSESLGLWYPFRALDGEERSEQPLTVARDNDAAFPVGSIAVDAESLRRVRFRKDAMGWSPTDEPTDHAVRMLGFEVIQQVPYKNGNKNPPEVTPVRFYAPLSEAKDGNVEDKESTAFNGPFADPKKEKFMSRLQLPGKPPYSSGQRNLHRKGKPITREELAKHISFDVAAALGNDLLLIDGKSITFDDLVLVDVQCVAVGSVQATLAVRHQIRPLF